MAKNTSIKTVLLAALVAFVATATAEAAPRGFYGVSSQTVLEPKEYELMGKGRVGTLRSLMSWETVQADRNGPPQWGGFDSVVREAAKNKITVLPYAFGTPAWVARDLDGRSCGGAKCAISAPRSPAALAQWNEFIGLAVERYGPGGAFWAENPDVPQKPIRAWQVWNEQNSKSFFGPKPSVKGYAKMLDSAAGAIRQRDRKADIVLGGMPGLDGARGAIPGPKYLKKLYKRKGVKKDFDGIAVHPYGAKVSKVINEVKRFDRETNKRDRGASIWITETGWGSKGRGNPLNVGKRGQAQRLKQTYKYFERKRGALKIKNVTWFSWRDSSTKICAWCPSSGLFTKSLKSKPSWRAYKKAAR